MRVQMFADAFHSKIVLFKELVDSKKAEDDRMDVDSKKKEDKATEMMIEDGEISEETEKVKEKGGEGGSLENICKELFPSLSPALSSLFWSLSLYDLFVPKGNFSIVFE